MKNISVIGPALLALGLQGCAVGPDWHRPSTALSSATDRFHYAPSAAGTAVDLSAWWAGFDDPVLDDLISRSLAANTELAAATARLRAARASVVAARGALLPVVGASASAGQSGIVRGPGSGTDSWQAGLDASWEADIFGGNRRAVDASAATARSVEANLFDVQRSITAEVALNYITARNTQARLAVARANLGYQDETLKIAGWRVQAGLVSALDLEQARTLRAQTAANIPQLELTYATATNRIAVLAGAAPGSLTALLDVQKPIPVAPDSAEAGLPAALLERRPDLRAAEATLAAEVARIGVAEAQLYPALRLTGSLTTSALSIGSLGSSVLGNLAAGITAPIFQGGQIRARIEGQKATADAALANYRGSVLQALEEVENALVSLDKAKVREASLATAEQAAQNSVAYARDRYAAGLTDFQTLLDAERSLLSSQDSRTSARADRATAAVQLYKALGGGWTPGNYAAAPITAVRPQ
jgi:outer membrane protein, multidrug efflux system